MRRTALLLLALFALATVIALVPWTGAAASPGAASAKPSHRDDPPPDAAAPPAEREAVAKDAPTDFVSTDDDGKVLPAVRDGLVVQAVHGQRGGAPCAHVPICVFWRRETGHGSDCGSTDDDGRFATSVADCASIENITLNHMREDEHTTIEDLLPLADDPRTVLVVVPLPAPVQVRVVDLQQQPIAGASIVATFVAADAAPRTHVLAGELEGAETDADGNASLTLAAGVHTFDAHSPDASELAQVCAAVPPAGRTLTLVLARLAARHGVDVNIDAPADFDGRLALHAWSDALPRIDGGGDVTAEAVARDLPVTRIDE